MKYTLPRNYSNAGIQVEIPDATIKAYRAALGNSTKAAIDKWLFENGYMPAAEYEMAKADTKVTAKPKREFKVDAEKAQVITLLYNALINDTDLNIANANIENLNRLISFSLGDAKYEVTLVRKKK